MGTPYATASLLFYDSVATDTQPDAGLVLHTALVSSIQSTLLGGNPGEVVSFAFASPSVSLYLELSGVTGESSAPGHPGVIALDSISLTSDGFAVHKAVDSTSTGLLTAEALGTPYATASLLVYSNLLAETRPDFALVYQHALVSSIVTQASQERPTEDVTFSVAGVTVTPEPATAGLLAMALVAAAALRRRRGPGRVLAGATHLGFAPGPAISMARAYAGRAAIRFTYACAFGRSSILRPPKSASEVRLKVTMMSAQVKSGPAR
jgi:type VI protein secretion system component Hcp